MELRFKHDKETGEIHISSHSVTEAEVAEALANKTESRIGPRGVRVAIGATEAGRTLRVVYAPDPGGRSAFVITAYELSPKVSWAYRKRLRKRKKGRR